MSPRRKTVAEAPASFGVHLPPEVRRAVELALDRKALDIVVLDLRGISSATDWFVVMSGTSDVHVKAIADGITEGLDAEDVPAGHVEGLTGRRWVLLDYIDFVVHVFHPQARLFYQLENLWGDAKRWEAPEA